MKIEAAHTAGWTASILGLALICTVFAILAYSKSVNIIGPSDTAVLSTFEPFTGVAMGVTHN